MTPEAPWSEGCREAPQEVDYWACLASGGHAVPPVRNTVQRHNFVLLQNLNKTCEISEKLSRTAKKKKKIFISKTFNLLYPLLSKRYTYSAAISQSSSSKIIFLVTVIEDQ